ncbi:MAG TPA: NUDIX domain-containing protein [Burkholderiaceae bacterium]|jgi:8-oxo-dGTP pyrophosphatase MutT (NUDIX family)|nr:NUDIX domain-containing protein [Burkholderiaceae bacterium]
MNDKVATPVDAATIMLLRDSPQGMEVFMVVRHHQIDFASGALVFPGGKVDKQDRDERVISRLSAYPKAETDQGTLRAAAIREAFEESGILLARRKGGADMPADDNLDRWREGLNKQTLTLGDMLVEGDLELACDNLAHFSHWITPVFMPKRFDTHFYLARVPADQIAGHDGHENVDSVWITPDQVIEDAREKRRTIIFPTLSNIVRLAQYKTVAEAFEGTLNSTIVPILPWMETRADGKYVCIPTDAGFTLTEHRAAGGPG